MTRGQEKHLILTIIGYSAFQAIPGIFIGATNLLFFGAGSLYATAQFFAECFTLSQVATLFFVAILPTRLSKPIQRLIPFFSGIIMLTGLFCLTIHSLSVESSSSLLVLSALLLGCSYSGSFSAWMAALAPREPRFSIYTVVIGTLGSGVLDAVMCLIDNITACFLVLSVIGIIHSAILLWFDRNKPASGDIAAEPTKQGGRGVKGTRPLSRRFLQVFHFCCTHWRPIVSIAVIGFAGGVARAMLVAEDYRALTSLSSTFFVGSLMASVILLSFRRQLEKAHSYDTLFTSLFFLSATAFLFVPFLPIEYLSVLITTENMLFSVASMCMIFLCLNLARGGNADLLFGTGIFVGCAYLGVGLGQSFGSFFSQEFGYILVSVLSVYLVLLMGVITGRHNSRRQKAEQPVPRESALLIHEVNEKALRENSVLTDRYGLSNREIDVLVLALNGRNAPAIAERLFISENTVRTHLKRIYKKLGIHNRQELLQLIETLYNPHL